MTILRPVEMNEANPIDEIKAQVSIETINEINIKYELSSSTTEEIMSKLIATHLLLLQHSDFREHLYISEIITSTPENKSFLTSADTPPNREIELNNKLKLILYKNKSDSIVSKIMADYNVPKICVNTILNYCLTLTRFFLHELIKNKKLNVRGILQVLDKHTSTFNSIVGNEILFKIKNISSNNRRRTSHYTRGKVFKDNYAFYYPIVVVFLILVAYMYYYFNLIS